jgi:hypothetical protein
MASARALPTAQVWDITINAYGQAQPPDAQLANADSFYFHNGASFPVTIQFSAVFSPITIQPGQSSNSLTLPGAGNFTINYGVTNASTGQQTGGPYGLQFGSGPIGIAIQGGSSSPGTVSIPFNGQIQFTSDANYTIRWSQANIFSISSLVPGVNPVATAQTVAASTSVTYTLTPSVEGTRGGGTVKINS